MPDRIFHVLERQVIGLEFEGVLPLWGTFIISTGLPCDTSGIEVPEETCTEVCISASHNLLLRAAVFKTDSRN